MLCHTGNQCSFVRPAEAFVVDKFEAALKIGRAAAFCTHRYEQCERKTSAWCTQDQQVAEVAAADDADDESRLQRSSQHGIYLGNTVSFDV
jgi:hypothetical protein